MDRRALAAKLQRNETSTLGLFASIDRLIARRYGVSLARIGGVHCLACAAFPIPLLHRAIGFGTLGEASQPTLDRIVRHYSKLGTPARVEVAEGVAPLTAVRLLERGGFSQERDGHHVHVRDVATPPPAPVVPGLRIERVRRTEAAMFGRLVREGFEAPGDLGDFFERTTVAAVRRLPLKRGVSLVGRVEGMPAATGVLFVASGVGGLYSGSVLPAYRGRGIQSAMIAARLVLGWERGLRLFASQTDPDHPSQHNLHDMGFRTLYRSSVYVRPTA